VKQKILIVEDDADTRRALSIRIESAGFEVVAAADSLQAMALAQRERPALILLDLGLPGGNGFTVLQRLGQRAALESVPVIVLSGRDADATRERALKAGAAAFLSKPVEAADLLACIREHLSAAPDPAAEKSDLPRILVVEDDADTRKGLAIRLRASGFDVGIAEDALAAMRSAIERRPDVILLDLGLPAGDGFVVLERMKLHPKLSTIPVVVLSARDPEVNRPRALAAGAREFLQKPADNDDLLAAIRRTLEAPADEGSPLIGS